MKKKVLIFGMDCAIGGVEEYLMNMYRNIDSNKIQFDFIPHNGTKLYCEDEVRSLGGEVYYITSKKDNILKNIIDLFKVFKKARKNHEIVYFNTCGIYNITPFLFAKIMKYPIIITHAHNTKSGNRSELIELFHYVNRIFVRNISKYCFSCSKAAGEWIFGKRFNRSGKVKIINNAIDCNKFKYNNITRSKIRNNLKINENQLIIGNVGRLSYQKNHSFLLEVFAEVLKVFSSAQLLIIGEGELEEALKIKAETLKINNNVKFLGKRSDISELMNAMDIFLFPSNFEGLGIVLIEAQATGLKCFTSDIIPNEVKVTDLINCISLNKNAKEWCNEIVDKINYVRKDTERLIKNSNYDIKVEAKKFEKFLLNI